MFVLRVKVLATSCDRTKYAKWTGIRKSHLDLAVEVAARHGCAHGITCCSALGTGSQEPVGLLQMLPAKMT